MKHPVTYYEYNTDINGDHQHIQDLDLQLVTFMML